MYAQKENLDNLFFDKSLEYFISMVWILRALKWDGIQQNHDCR